MDERREELLRQLHSANPDVRSDATEKLWRLWFGAAGPKNERELMRAERLREMGEFDAAETILNRIIAAQRDFAEVWNRRATLRYLRHQYDASAADCRVALQLDPNHFGAWHGLGLCLMNQQRYADAIAAFRRALEIQPFAQTNWDLIAECLAKLN